MEMRLGRALVFLFVVSFGLSPLAPYLYIAGSLITLDRISLLLFVLVLAAVFNRGIVVRRASSLGLGLVYCFFCVIITTFIFNLNSSISILNAYIFWVAYIFLCMLFNDSISTDRIVSSYRNVFLIWAGIAIIFAAFSLFYQIILGEKIYPTFLEVSEVSENRMLTQMYSGRLFLPFASAPFLSFMCFSVVLFLLIDNRNVVRKSSILKYVIIFLLLIIGLLTQSRSTLYALLLSLFIFYMFKFIKNRRITKLGFFIVNGIIFSLLLFSYYNSYEILDSQRLIVDINELETSRHMSLRLNALDLYIGSGFINLLIGNGFGFLVSQIGAPHTFTSYLTALYEVGFLGFLIYSLILSLPFFTVLFLRQKNELYRYSRIEVLTLNSFIFVSNFFYEFKLLPILAIVLAFNFFMAYAKD